MNLSIQKLFSFPFLIKFFLLNTKKQKKFIKKTIALDLIEIEKENDKSLNEKDINKILSYYGLAVTSILGEGFCLLRGRKMTDSERIKLTYLGGLTGLFDDFFDEKNTSEEHIKELINNPSIDITKNSNEKLFIQFYLKAIDENNSDLVKLYFNKVFDAQVLSKKQINHKISRDEIFQITKEKGGISILFYRCVFEGEITGPEREMLFNIGALGQLENDIFDIYKDYKEGIYTLATTETHIINLRKIYISLMENVFDLISNSEFPKKNKKLFSHFIALITSRGMVCLDFLKKLDKHDPIDLSKYSRSDLICDMGKLNNQLKLYQFYLMKKIK